MKFTRAASEDDIARVTEDFSRASKAAVSGGFDALELHLGHNYLLSAFLSPKLNKRKDRWGGSIENRARFPRQVVRAVRDVVGGDVAVTAKLNMTDGVRRGLDVEESIAVAQMLEEDGALDAVTLTGGSSLVNPMYLFRGDAPIAEMAETMPRLMRVGFKLTARRFMKTYPFEEAYLLPQARRFRAALKMPLVLLGGINQLSTINKALDEGFAFAAMARALLCEPDLVHKMRADAATQALCIHCNKCMPTIYTGTHCVIV